VFLGAWTTNKNRHTGAVYLYPRRSAGGLFRATSGRPSGRHLRPKAGIWGLWGGSSACPLGSLSLTGWGPCHKKKGLGWVRGWGGGALRCLADSENPSHKIRPNKSGLGDKRAETGGYVGSWGEAHPERIQHPGKIQSCHASHWTPTHPLSGRLWARSGYLG
jgi:hypothetical protein